MLQKERGIINLYLGEGPEQWETSVYMFDVWGVHHPWPGNAQDMHWHVTHLPTSRCAFVAYKVTEAVRTAKALAALGRPDVNISKRGFVTLPEQWVRQTAQALQDIEVYCPTRYGLMTPQEMVERLSNGEKHEQRS